MNKGAQAGLEYLMTYGWALVLIATLVGAIVFIVGTPEETSFTSSDPTKLMLKSGISSGNESQVVLQNITGGKITITGLDVTCLPSGCTLNGEAISLPLEIPAGGEIHVTGIAHTGNESIGIQYTDFAGLDRSATIRTGGAQISDCGNGEKEGPEACDGTDGVPSGNFECSAGCDKIYLTDCETIGTAGTYYLSQNISTSSGNCIQITTDNVAIECEGKEITCSGACGDAIYAISIGANTTVNNCIISDFGSGIHCDGPDNWTLTNNTISGTAGNGIRFNSCHESTLTNNTTNSNNGGISIYGCENCVFTGNQANNNTNQGFLIEEGFGATLNSNTACNNGAQDIYCLDPPYATGSDNTAGNVENCDLTGTSSCS